MNLWTRMTDFILKSVWIYTYEVLVMVFNIIRKLEDRSRKQKATAMFLLAGLLLAGGLTGCKRDHAALAQKHMSAAQEYIKNKKLDEAAIEIRRAINENPRLADAHFMLAQVGIAKGDMRMASQELGLTLKNNPEHHEANVMVGELLLASGSFSDAKTKADMIVDKWPNDNRGSIMLAEAKAGLGDTAGASTIINQRLAANPNDARALFDLAGLQATGGNYTEAERNMRRVLEIMPTSISAHTRLAAILQKAGRGAEVEGVFKDAVSKSPNSIPAHSMLLSYYTKLAKFDLAETEAKTIKQLNGKGSQNRTIVARVYLMANRPVDAEREFQSVIADGDPDGTVTRELVLFYLNQGKPEQGRGLLEKILKSSPNDPGALILRGRLELAENKLNEAVDDLQHALKSDPDLGPGYLFLSQALERQGNQQQAASALNEALRRDPKNAIVRFELAKQEMRGGQVDEAMADLEKVLSGPQVDVTPSLLYAHALVSKNQYAEADKRMAELIKQVNQPGAQSLIYNSWALIKLRENNPKEARKYAAQALTLNPHLLQNLSVLANTYAAAKELPAGIQEVQRTIQKYPDWADAYEVSAGLSGQMKDYATAEQMLQKASQLSPSDIRFQRELAELYLIEGKTDLARSLYEKLANNNPNDVFSLLRTAALYEPTDWPKAEKLYRHCLELEPNNALVKNNLAFGYLSHNGNLDVALKLAQEAKEQVPTDPSVNDTIAWAYVQKGSYNSAVEYLKQSLQKNPTQPAYNYHIGYAYAKLGNNVEAKKALTEALKTPSFASTKDGSDAKQLLASLK